MNTKSIVYKERRIYKYDVWETVTFDTGIIPLRAVDWGLLAINMDGQVTIRTKYAWDGPSGPTFDKILPWLYKKFMRGSLLHDVLYQFMREGIISRSNRKRADQLLREICLEDGMVKIRAWWIYRGVRVGSARSALSDLLYAP